MNTIKSIRIPSIAGHSIGSLITASGIAAIIVGITWIIQHNDNNLPAFFRGLFVLRGGIVACFGLLTLAFIGKINYESDDWEYMIRFT
jgi:hypothetical protein